MIRINLLGMRQVQKARVGKRQLVLFIGLLMIESFALYVLYEREADVVATHRRGITQLEQEITELKKDTSDYDRLEKDRKRLLSQRDVIKKLAKSKIGPTWFMDELSSILSIGKGPTISDQSLYQKMISVNPQMAYNPRWNPRRLWLENVSERRGRITILGRAKDYDDVAEFLKRMNLSKYFTKVQLKRNDRVQDRGGSRVIRFRMAARVRY